MPIFVPRHQRRLAHSGSVPNIWGIGVVLITNSETCGAVETVLPATILLLKQHDVTADNATSCHEEQWKVMLHTFKDGVNDCDKKTCVKKRATLLAFYSGRWDLQYLFRKVTVCSLTRPGVSVFDLLKEPGKRKIPPQKTTVDHILWICSYL